MICRCLFLALSAVLQLVQVARGQFETVTLPANNRDLSATTEGVESVATQRPRKIPSRLPAVSLEDDENLVDDEPFLILVYQPNMSGHVRRQAAAEYSWLMTNGNATVNCSLAARYALDDGRLRVNGRLMSTNDGVLSMPFSPAETVGGITSNFTIQDGVIRWHHPSFTEGIVQFYKVPPGLLENALILAKFVGPMERQRGWSPIILFAQPGTK